MNLFKNTLALILAYLFLALALIGIVLPGLPTVPFLLLAAWCAARGSRRLHNWLYAHPHLGQLLIDWEREKAVSRNSKIIATVMLAGSWMVMYTRIDSHWIMALITLFFIGGIIFLYRRPEPGG